MYEKFKVSIRRIIKSIKWLFLFFPKNPRLELYIRAKNKINQRFYANVLADKEKGIDSYLEQYIHQPLPKLIWTYWAQGVDSTPYIVNKCFESWRELNPNWKFHVLDESNVAQFVDMSDIPRWLPFRYRANILRLRLLKQYGGVWVDSTTFCHRPLDEWQPLMCSTGFFVFSNPSEDRFVENWYIASAKGHVLIDAWERVYAQYIRTLPSVHDAYFVAFYTFQWAILTDKALGEAYRRCGSLPAAQAFFLMSSLEGRTDFSDVKALVDAGLPVSKLNWRFEMSNQELDLRFESLRAVQKQSHGWQDQLKSDPFTVKTLSN